MQVCIISGRYPATTFSSAINHKVYADLFGYTYIHCNYPTKTRNPYFNKINYILQYIDLYDYMVWIDDDAFFVDFNKDIMLFAPQENHFISLCKSPSFKTLKTYLSSGQFILKCNTISKQFLSEALSLDLGLVKSWWRKELGYFTNGDQDAIIYLLHERQVYKNRYMLHDYKAFNSRCENLFEKDIHKPFIIHFTGRGPTKQKNLLNTQKRLNLHASLVPNSILKEYGIDIKEIYDYKNDKVSFRLILAKVKKRLKKWLKPL
ncbi:glycosyltransferase family 77 protein [Aestuariivivens marinum]|uniref:glycosyltransferase family 77 protein n=1 Tax=Aestuariivivens marinum TaxID=2913555 RepID=UPI001F58001D|nr:glycosyltransferase family 77 protein [Aestuariivivens marinum]